MAQSMDDRHRQEIARAYRSARFARHISLAVVVIGALTLAWVVGAMAIDEIGLATGVLAAAGVVVGSLAAGTGLHAASYRTSIGAASLEHLLDAD